MSETHDAPRGELDLAPGEERPDAHGLAQGVRGYLGGLALAAGLTAAAVYFCFSGLIYGPAVPAALVALAVAQMGVHLVFFLHITTGPDNTNNVLELALGLMLVFLVIGGSLWIMHAMNANMTGHGGRGM